MNENNEVNNDRSIINENLSNNGELLKFMGQGTQRLNNTVNTSGDPAFNKGATLTKMGSVGAAAGAPLMSASEAKKGAGNKLDKTVNPLLGKANGNNRANVQQKRTGGTTGLNSSSALALRQKIAKNAVKSTSTGEAAEKILESQKNKGILANRKGLLGRLASNFEHNQKQKVKDEGNDGGGTLFVAGKTVKVVLFTLLGPVFVFVLIIFLSIFVIFSILNNLGINPEKAMETSFDDIDSKLKDSNENKDAPKGAESMAEDDDLSFTIIDNSNSIYSIKLSKVNVLETSKNIDANEIFDEFNFDIESINGLYPPSADYNNVPYSYAFYYKLYNLNEYYKGICGKQILNLPLLMITLNQESDDMAEVFASNVGAKEGITINKQYMDETFNEEVFAFNYNWSDYEYYRHSSLHDMEILAQHMVKVYGTSYCKYDADGYREFLNEFVEKKYFLSADSDATALMSKNSSNYFQKYTLTEDQLLQIASLCAQEQGHNNPKGAAAEASLMANKYEVEGAKFANQYSSNGEALYHFVRDNIWWSNAAKYMDRRDANQKIIDAVKDVLVNGNRTLPKYVNSHDCYDCNRKNTCPSGINGDICELIVGDITFKDKVGVTNKTNYIPHKTIVKNVYGSTATFYSFPSSTGDPFSYKDKKLREKFGECHYDPDEGEFVDCLDFRDALVLWAVEIASNDKFGYSQAKRDSLIDFDCSSFVYYALINNGFSTGQLGSKPFTTLTERELLLNNGFEEIDLSTGYTNLKKGDILWRKGYTEIYIGEGLSVGAHSASNGTAEDGQHGDQNGKEISVVNVGKENWTYAYRYSK